MEILNVIKVCDASFFYAEKARKNKACDTEKYVFKNLNFSLQKGTVCSVLGANGSGKTSLLKCLIGLLKLTTGSIYIEEKEQKSIKNCELLNKVSYIPQSKTIFGIKVFDMVLLGRIGKTSIFSEPTQEDIYFAKNALELLGIEALSEKRMDEISGGQQQLVFLARGIASGAKILILDEPEMSLDLKNRTKILETFKKLAESGYSVLFTTHEILSARKFSNNSLLCLNYDKWIFGKSEEVLTDENIYNAFGVLL